MQFNELRSPPLSPKVRSVPPPVGPPRRKSGPPAPLPLRRKNSLESWDRKGSLPNYTLGLGSGIGLVKPHYRMPKVRNNSTGSYEGRSHQFSVLPSPRRGSADDTYSIRSSELMDIQNAFELPKAHSQVNRTPPTPPKQSTDFPWQPDYGGLSLIQLGQPPCATPTRIPRTSSYNTSYNCSPVGSPPLSPRRASADVPSTDQIKTIPLSERRKSVGDAPSLRGCISPGIDMLGGFLQVEVSVVSAVDPSLLPILLKLRVSSDSNVHTTEVLASPLPIPFGLVQILLDCPQRVLFELLGSTTATGTGDIVGSCSFMLTKQMVRNLPVTLTMSLRDGGGDIFQNTVAELCVQLSTPTAAKERKAKRVSFAFDEEIKPTPESENSSPAHNLDPLSIETELQHILPLPLSQEYDDGCCSYDLRKKVFAMLMILIVVGIVIAILAALGVME